MVVCLLFLHLFEQVELLAAIQLMWTCYTHPPIYLQRTVTTPEVNSFSFRIVRGYSNVPQGTWEHGRFFVTQGLRFTVLIQEDLKAKPFADEIRKATLSPQRTKFWSDWALNPRYPTPKHGAQQTDSPAGCWFLIHFECWHFSLKINQLNSLQKFHDQKNSVTFVTICFTLNVVIGVFFDHLEGNRVHVKLGNTGWILMRWKNSTTWTAKTKWKKEFH